MRHSKKIEGYVNTVIIDFQNETLVKKFNSGITYTRSNFESASEEYEKEKKMLKAFETLLKGCISAPKLLSYDDEKREIKMEYIKGENFHVFMLKNCNKFYFDKRLFQVFSDLGKNLAKLHNENLQTKNGLKTVIHGDLVSHNFLFKKENTKINMYLIDPCGFKKAPYADLASFLSIFYLLNFVYRITFGKKFFQLKKVFLQKYIEVCKYDFEKKELKKHVLNYLEKKAKRNPRRKAFWKKPIYFLYANWVDSRKRRAYNRIEKYGLEI